MQTKEKQKILSYRDITSRPGRNLSYIGERICRLVTSDFPGTMCSDHNQVQSTKDSRNGISLADSLDSIHLERCDGFTLKLIFNLYRSSSPVNSLKYAENCSLTARLAPNRPKLN